MTLGKVEMKDKNEFLIDGQQADCLLQPGTLVSQSGLYEICHNGESRSTVILIKSTVFPYCRDCGEDVRFRLIKAAPHISEDPDFIEFVGDPEYDSQDSADPRIVFVTQLGLDHGFRYSQEDIQAG